MPIRSLEMRQPSYYWDPLIGATETPKKSITLAHRCHIVPVTFCFDGRCIYVLFHLKIYIECHLQKIERKGLFDRLRGSGIPATLCWNIRSPDCFCLSMIRWLHMMTSNTDILKPLISFIRGCFPSNVFAMGVLMYFHVPMPSHLLPEAGRLS